MDNLHDDLSDLYADIDTLQINIRMVDAEDTIELEQLAYDLLDKAHEVNGLLDDELNQGYTE
jgi:hypothetical protein